MTEFDKKAALSGGGSWPRTALIEGGEGMETALEAACAVLREGSGRPGDIERRVREGIHPDVILIDRGDKLIAVDDMRALRRDAYVAPLEGERKVYIIKNAHNMNGAAQNAALKLFEEPPRGVYFILLCENSRALLETVRSRCVIFAGWEGEDEAADEEAAALACEFARAASDELTLLEFCLKNEKIKRDRLAAFLSSALDLTGEALRIHTGREGSEAAAELSKLPLPRLLRLAQILRRRRDMNESNVGAAHLMGTIPAELFAEE